MESRRRVIRREDANKDGERGQRKNRRERRNGKVCFKCDHKPGKVVEESARPLE